MTFWQQQQYIFARMAGNQKGQLPIKAGFLSKHMRASYSNYLRVVSDSRKFDVGSDQRDTPRTTWAGCVRETYRISVVVYRCLHATAVQYLFELCTLVADVASQRHLRSVYKNGLMVPHHKLSSVGWHAFSIAASLVWNSLVDYLRHPALGLKSHGRQLNTFLISHY